MGIDTERDIEANLQIGPTDKGMVRLFIDAEEIMAAAHRAGKAGKNKR